MCSGWLSSSECINALRSGEHRTSRCPNCGKGSVTRPGQRSAPSGFGDFLLEARTDRLSRKQIQTPGPFPRRLVKGVTRRARVRELWLLLPRPPQLPKANPCPPPPEEGGRGLRPKQPVLRLPQSPMITRPPSIPPQTCLARQTHCLNHHRHHRHTLWPSKPPRLSSPIASMVTGLTSTRKCSIDVYADTGLNRNLTKQQRKEQQKQQRKQQQKQDRGRRNPRDIPIAAN